MHYVGAFILLRAQTPIKLPSFIEGKGDNGYGRVNINEEGEGGYFWGTSILNGYSIQLYVPNPFEIICFTSTTNNGKNLMDFLLTTVGLSIEMMKIPFRCKVTLQDDEISNFSLDPIVGASFILIDSKTRYKCIVKFMTNGVVSFSLNNSKTIIEKIIKLYGEVLDSCNETK